MPKIISKEPFNPKIRAQQLVNFDDGSKRVRCFNPLNAPYYFDKGQLKEVDIKYTELQSLAIDTCQIRNKAIASVGIRESADPNKFIGIRPDYNQYNGEEQLEFTLKKIIIDGNEKSINLSKLDKVDDNCTDIGDLIIHSCCSRTRQLIKISNAEKEVQIHYEIDLTGLKFKNEFKNIEHNTFFSDQRIRFANFNSVDPAGWKRFDNWKYSEKTNQTFDTAICKVKFDLIDLQDKKFAEKYNIENDIHEHLIPKQFVQCYSNIRKHFYGTSYLKDAIVFQIKNIPEVHEIGRGSVKWFREKLISEVIEPAVNEVTKGHGTLTYATPSIFGLANDYLNEQYHDGTDGFAVLLLDGKIIGSFLWDMDHVLSFVILTSDISKYNYLWKTNRKMGDSTVTVDRSTVGYINIDYDKFVNRLQNFMNAYAYTDIKISGNYAIPEKDNSFKILNEENRCIFKISMPKLFDENLNYMDHLEWLPDGEDPEILHDEKGTLQINHSLKKISNTKYEYIKHVRETNPLSTILKSAVYLDVETIYGDTADEYILNKRPAGTWSWSEVLEASSGNIFNNTSTYGNLGTSYGGESNKGITYYRMCSRTILVFDTTEILAAKDIELYVLGMASAADPVYCCEVPEELDASVNDYSNFLGDWSDKYYIDSITSWTDYLMGDPSGYWNIFDIGDKGFKSLGMTCYMLKGNYDLNGNTPDGYKSGTIITAETAYPPYLELTLVQAQRIYIVT